MLQKTPRKTVKTSSQSLFTDTLYYIGHSRIKKTKQALSNTDKSF